MKLSVASEALVMPSSSDFAVAGSPPAAMTRLVLALEEIPRDLLVEQEVGVARIHDLHEAHHLANHDLDVLVVDRHTLGAVDLLDLVHQVALHFLFAENRQDVVRVDRALGEGIAGLDELALLDRHVGVARDRVLALLVALALDHDPALTAHRLGDLIDTVDLRDHRRVLGFARLEELDDARQTAGDVLGLGHLARDLGEHVARRELVALVDREMGTDGQLVAPGLVLLAADDLDGRDPFARAERLDDDLVGVAGELVDLLADVLALDEVVEVRPCP